MVRNKAGVERARNFFGITHVRDLTAVRDVGFGAKKGVGFGAKKGGELGGGTDAGVMSSHNPPKKYVQRTAMSKNIHNLRRWNRQRGLDRF